MDLKLVWIVLNYLGSSYLEKFALIFHSRGKFMGMPCKKNFTLIIPISCSVFLASHGTYVNASFSWNKSEFCYG